MDPNRITRAAEFGVQFIPVAVKLRNARDSNSGVEFTADEVKTLVETLQALCKGPDEQT